MKKALIVGINQYPHAPLEACVNDAKAIHSLMKSNYDKRPNFESKLKLDIPTKSKLLGYIKDLFSGRPDISLFYFSGHGYTDEYGETYIVTPDVEKNNEGVSMTKILSIANQSKCMDKVIILDCCYSGSFGSSLETGKSSIGEGVTILTSSMEDEISLEINGHGIFTALLIEALKGGAADLRGNITPGSIYSFIDQSLGAWGQRPVFKSNVNRFIVLKEVEPAISMEALNEITELFKHPENKFQLNPSYEFTNNPDIKHEYKKPFAELENVEKLKVLQQMNNVGLVMPVGEEHMYFAAMNNKSCQLTPMGQFYWNLIKNDKI